MTEEQRQLAMDLLHLHHLLGGPTYMEGDVIRLANGIARHAWLDQQLNQMCREMMSVHLQGGERDECSSQQQQ